MFLRGRGSATYYYRLKLLQQSLESSVDTITRTSMDPLANVLNLGTINADQLLELAAGLSNVPLRDVFIDVLKVDCQVELMFLSTWFKVDCQVGLATWWIAR